jgi:hypothetical protein
LSRSIRCFNTRLPELSTPCNGNPINFEITGGQVHDSKVAPQPIELVDEAEPLYRSVCSD